MNDTQAKEMIELLQRIAAQVERTAIAMEVMSAGAAPEPNLKRPIGAFPGFDWSSIGADVLDSDDDGVSAVSHRGLVYTRRSGSGKYGAAVWFSRALGGGVAHPTTPGGGEDRKIPYARLITFKDWAPAEPVPSGAKQAVETGRATTTGRNRPEAPRVARPVGNGGAPAAPATNAPAAQPGAPAAPLVPMPRYEARMVDEMPPSAFAGIPDRQPRGDRPPSAPAPMPPELVAEMQGQGQLRAAADPAPALASDPAPEASGSEWGPLIEAAEQSGTMAAFIGVGGVRVELARASDVTEAEREDWLALADSAMCRVVAKVARAGALSEPARQAAVKRIEQVPEGTPDREGALSALAGAKEDRQ